MRDKSYMDFPMGVEAASYLIVKRKRLTTQATGTTNAAWRSSRHFPDLDLDDFEPPAGTQRIEEFLDHQYGDGSPRNYNKNLSIPGDFFRFQFIRGRLHGDPTLADRAARAARSTGPRSAMASAARSSAAPTTCATGSRCGCCSTTRCAKARSRRSSSSTSTTSAGG